MSYNFICSTDSYIPFGPIDFPCSTAVDITMRGREKPLEDELVVCPACGMLCYLKELECRKCGTSLAGAKLLYRKDIE
jgi:hypothetical protein